LKGSYEKTNISAVTKSTKTTATHMMSVTVKKAKPFTEGMRKDISYMQQTYLPQQTTAT
jgi:hypothetical protein